jgi:hypothetical protein
MRSKRLTLSIFQAPDPFCEPLDTCVDGSDLARNVLRLARSRIPAIDLPETLLWPPEGGGECLQGRRPPVARLAFLDVAEPSFRGSNPSCPSSVRNGLVTTFRTACSFRRLEGLRTSSGTCGTSKQDTPRVWHGPDQASSMCASADTQTRLTCLRSGLTSASARGRYRAPGWART